MNFPKTQRTGRLAELKVEEVFTNWSWTVGQDRIDTGYDFFVQPDITIFKGHRFLVQVKSTDRTKGGRVAKIHKGRLREYAANPLPVFLVWSSGDGVLHWLHIQPWTKQNAKRISGNGDAGVKLPRDQQLDDKQAFTTYLIEILKPLAEQKSALSHLAIERSRYLSSIDPRLGVRAEVKDGIECYEIYASTEPTRVGFEIKVKNDIANIQELNKAFHYGLPASVDVTMFRIKGSMLFPALGIDKSNGKLHFQPQPSFTCTVKLFPGSKYSIQAKTYSFKATLYVGSHGSAISNDSIEDILNFNLRMDLNDTGEVSGNITLGLNDKRIQNSPIQYIDSLGILGDWAYEALLQGSSFLELSIESRRLLLPIKNDSLQNARSLLHDFFVIGMMQKIARALDSGLILCADFALSDKDVEDVHLAHGLLKGERLSVNPEPVEFTAHKPITYDNTGNFYIKTSLEFTLAGQKLGVIPVEISLINYFVEPISLQQQYRLIKGEDSKAYMYYDERPCVPEQNIYP